MCCVVVCCVQALDVIKQTKVAELLGIEATEMASGRTEQPPVTDDSDV